MKKSVAPLSLKEPVQGVRKCIPPVFLKIFGGSKWEETEKIFWFFLGKYTTLFRIYAIDLKRGC